MDTSIDGIPACRSVYGKPASMIKSFFGSLNCKEQKKVEELNFCPQVTFYTAVVYSMNLSQLNFSALVFCG